MGMAVAVARVVSSPARRSLLAATAASWWARVVLGLIEQVQALATRAVIPVPWE